MVGIAISFFASRFLWSLVLSGKLLASIPESSHTVGVYLFVAGFFLLVPFSLIILSLRFLEFLWEHSPTALSRARRYFQAVLVKFGYSRFAIPLPRWTRMQKFSFLPFDEICELPPASHESG
jgi:hypothetical protein